ncbi:unnamed protein product [Rhizophagus irregularis]|nr:unnamed protein product [Rhizophagus irregularis]CAB5207716.1 unnamed protein product [Rhizophagus irregularis]
MKVRPQVPCNCKKCNGKWTESRTREKHYAKEEKLRLAMEEPDKKKRKVSGSNPATIKNRDGRHARLQFINPAEACQQYSDEDFLPIDDETLKNRDARHARHQFINPAEVDQQYSDEDFRPIDDETLSDDDEALTMKQFSAPDFDDTTQLVALYQRAGFEELLRKWTNRSVNQGLMFDIYDGDIWKTFPSQHDIPDPSPFFAQKQQILIWE